MERSGKRGKPDKQTSTWLIGAAAVLIAALVGGWLVFRSPSDAPADKPSSNALAVINTEAALKEHASYSKLKELRASRDQLAAELAAEKQRNLKLFAPDANKRPFDDAFSQKLHQKKITTHGELMEELKKAEKKKRQELETEWQAERKEVNDIYLNEILNIRLKLDNADMMRLSKETREAMIARMQTLQQERGQKQIAVNRKYEAKISEYIAGLAEEKGIDREEALALFSEDIRTYELRKRSAAQKRNVEEIQKRLVDSMQSRQRLMAKRTELAAKEAELNVLEGRMLNDIAGKASKLAVVHHLSAILAISPDENKSGKTERTYPTVINVNAKDLTQELIKELRQ